MSEPMVEIKYTGKMGTVAETPWGYKTAGELFEVTERQARDAVKTKNYAYKGERLAKPDTTPDIDPIEQVLGAGEINTPEPSPRKKRR